jgi:hypothetical protein
MRAPSMEKRARVQADTHGLLTYIPFRGLVVTACQPHSPVASQSIA